MRKDNTLIKAHCFLIAETFLNHFSLSHHISPGLCNLWAAIHLVFLSRFVLFSQHLHNLTADFSYQLYGTLADESNISAAYHSRLAIQHPLMQVAMILANSLPNTSYAMFKKPNYEIIPMYLSSLSDEGLEVSLVIFIGGFI